MRIRTAVTGLIAAPLVLLAACGTETATGTKNTSTQSSAATSASSSQQVQGPIEPPASVVADPVPADQMPSVDGKIGESPTLTFPSGKPPASLQRQTLVEGTGATVGSGDLLVANYVGQVWGSDTFFDSSFDRGEQAGTPGQKPAAFAIGVGKVVNGWDVGLVGTKVGSRVLLSLPPSDGYGARGNSGAGIAGTDTIVFVVDIVNTFPAGVGGQADAVIQTPAPTNVTIDGELGSEPTIRINDGAKAPTQDALTVVAKGTGDPVAAGKTMVFHLVEQPWDGTTSSVSSWDQGEFQQAPVTADGILKSLIGVPVGSRVLLDFAATEANPATNTKAFPAVSYVFDIVGQF